MASRHLQTSSEFLRKRASFMLLYSRPVCRRKVHSLPKREKASTAVLSEGSQYVDENTKGVLETGSKPTTASARPYPDPAYSSIDLSFANAKHAYSCKTNWELFRALVVFNLCSVSYLVENNKQLMKLGRKVLGKRLFQVVMKGTFYGQFVAGEDEIRIRPLVEFNKQFGVKSILDYSVEKDLTQEEARDAEMGSCASDADPAVPLDADVSTKFRPHREFGDRREKVTGARTYFYEDESQCDENMHNFLKGIDAVSGATNATGFSAVKLTALGRPQLLLQLSEVLTRIRLAFERFAQPASRSGTIKQHDFMKYLKSLDLDDTECKKWYTVLDPTRDGEIDLLDWHNLLEVNIRLCTLLKVPNLKTGAFEPLLTSLTEEEEYQMKQMLKRIDTVAKYGRDKDVRIMIDAEQTYFQAAINRLCMEMMRKYNKEKAIIFNTYQCYLKDAHGMLTTDMALSRRENFYFGAKLVRGAYIEQERLRAETLGYPDPINPTYEATTAMYQRVVTEVMEQIQTRPRGQIAVMIATHNEDSVRYTVERMKQYDIHASDRLICFGQLLGMCDQVSFSLGQAGYSVYKYVPYGPVEEVIPYLSRRATENGSMLMKVQKEKKLMGTELWRRLKAGQFFYKPCPPYTSPTASVPAPP